MDDGSDIKINIGAGKSKIPGYISVDLRPIADVQADMRELPASWKGRITEIIANHCIEHLTFWEAEEALVHWQTMMKPGGKVILECPDIRKCCMNLLKYPDRPAFGLWGIYGLQTKPVPEMVHKSGWTAEMLIGACEKAGFSSAYEAPPQWHKKELRDLRVEAIK